MLNAITPKTRIIFIANPNNPTGTLISPGQRLSQLNRPAFRRHVTSVFRRGVHEFIDKPQLPDTPQLRSGSLSGNPSAFVLRTFSSVIQCIAGTPIGEVYGIRRTSEMRLVVIPKTRDSLQRKQYCADRVRWAAPKTRAHERGNQASVVDDGRNLFAGR